MSLIDGTAWENEFDSTWIEKSSNKIELDNLINVCNEIIINDSDEINRQRMNDEIDGLREQELRLKNCGMRNLRDMLRDKYSKL